MGDSVKIDSALFHERLSSFTAQWKNDRRSGDAIFNGVGSIIVMVGKSDESGTFEKNNAFQFWLLGYEFPATMMLFTSDSVYIVTTKKKASYLEPLKGGKVPLEIFTRGKDAEENEKIFEKCTEIIKSAGKKVGTLPKTSMTGPFVEEWQKSFETISKEVEEIDIAAAISSSGMAVKDEKELRAIRDASRASTGVMIGYFVDEMSDILDNNTKITHSSLANKVNNKIDDPKFFQQFKFSDNFDPQQLDWAVPPVIQSGGSYDLKLANDADNNNMHPSVIIAALGLRYQSYASFVARTYLVEPTKSEENNYAVLLQVHAAMIKKLRDGVVAKDVYNEAINVLREAKSQLEKNFVRNVGYGIGIEAKDNTLVLNAKNTRTLRDGMTLVITTGFNDLENADTKDKKRKTYSLMLSDTVRISTGEAIVFTRDAPTDMAGNSFFFLDEDAEPTPQKSKPKKDPRVGSVAQQNIKSTRLRTDRKQNTDAEKEAARKEHQKELHAKKQQQGLERYGEGTGDLNGTEEKKFKRYESYKRDNQFPSKVKDLVICVDSKNMTIVLPIMGRPVPFHINTVKNVSSSDEGEFASLRINFLSPGQGVGRKDDQPFEDPNAHFVRSLVFRSKDHDRMAEIANQITEVKKSAARREQEKKDMEDVVEQGTIQEIRNRRPHRLETIFLRPALEGKRLAGALEIHQNGLRYQHPTGTRVDVLFSNIKHLFFQPCDHELIVIIHVHLKDPIIVGKKKSKEIQFYREATEMAFDETGNRKRKHRYGDEEEFEAEQEERRRRAALNKEFRNFAEKISDAAKSEAVRVDIPFRELGFNGVPARSSVLVQPTTDCLVQLTEPPFLVVSLDEIEVVHLERVQFGLKNFDMVLVMHDFQKPPIHINTIPVENIDQVKDWLDSVDIPFSEGPLNLNWPQIMKTVTADPHTFFAEGGWSFLDNESDSEESEEESQESNFEVSEDELKEMSEEESEDDSDFDEDASAEASDEDVSAESDEGEDWDELEKKASKKDRESGLDAEDKKKRR